MTGRVWFGTFSGLCIAGVSAVPSALLAGVAAVVVKAWVDEHVTRDVDN